MLIRKPASEVFEALVNPEITSKFWFTKGSARLEAGKTVEWEWEQFGIRGTVSVHQIEKDRFISFQWPTTVEITFEPKSAEATFVRVIEKGFDENDEKLIENIVGQTEGWALVLSALKAYLEHDIILKVVSDHKPDA